MYRTGNDGGGGECKRVDGEINIDNIVTKLFQENNIILEYESSDPGQ